MKNVWLWRIRESLQGTEGLLFTKGFNCKTLELPWNDNTKNKSCIPTGKYEVTIRKSKRFGIIYWILNVENRSYIYIHSGNFAGNIDFGYKSDIDGCLLLGEKFGYLYGQRAVLNSKTTVKNFMSYMKNQPFILNVNYGF